MRKRITNFIARHTLCVCCLVSYYEIFSQIQQDTLSIEHLHRYKKVIDSITSLKDSLEVTYQQAIMNQPAIKSTIRFKEIKEAKEDIPRLKAIGVTTAEMEAYKKIVQLHKSLADEFRKSYTQLISDSLGIEDYNKIKKMGL